jgi:hypothetical protein
MKLKHLAILILLVILTGCGGGGGSTGAITVTAAVSGTNVTAQATYTNPNATTSLNGVPITFSAQINNQTYPIGTYPTGSTGIANASFNPQAFNGSQTITVVATSGDLSSFATVTMVGSTLAVSAPGNLQLSTTNAAGSSFTYPLTSVGAFVTITDPFVSDLSGHTIDITATVVPTNYSFALNSATTLTGSGGTAPFPGGNVTLVVPPAGQATTMTITFTVTDTTTGLTGSGGTTVTLTNSNTAT